MSCQNTVMRACNVNYPQTAEWGGGSTCEKCGIPFFWNIKDMWSRKVLGVRQVSMLVQYSNTSTS